MPSAIVTALMQASQCFIVPNESSNHQEWEFMNNSIKAGLLTIALGTISRPSIPMPPSSPMVGANAPGRARPSHRALPNTIRNRVVGSENVGANPIAVACDFEPAIQ